MAAKKVAVTPAVATPEAKPTPTVPAATPTRRWYRLERLSNFEYRLLAADLPVSATDAVETQDGKPELPRVVLDRAADHMYASSKKEK